MSNYRKTMTEALQEMKPLNERMRMGRQLINPNKEVMVVKKNKVVVIDKKDQDKYMKQGWELAEEVELDESVIDKVKEIASKKQAKKIGGVMVDSFTASAISQIYDKVNDANKKKMEKLPITKLANLAFKMMQKNEFVPEEVGLDEGTKQVLAHGGKGQYKAVRDGSITKVMYKGKVVGTADFDRGADSFFASIKGEKGQKSFDDAQAMVDYFAKNKITEEVDLDEADDFKPHMMYDPKTGKGYKADTMDDHLRMKKMGYTHDAPKKEEVELDEAKQVLAHGGKGKYKVVNDGSGSIDVMFKGKSVGKGDYDRGAGSFFMSIKGEKGQKSFDDAQAIADYFAKNKITEEVELDEGRMKELHGYIKDKKSAEEIAKLMKLDVKTIKALMNSYNPEEVEEGAAADARRAMRRDPEMRQRAFSKDNSATDDDVKGASKNIMMQMRKAQSLNGRFDVEFADGKKVKIPAKMAIAVQQKYNSMKRPAEKEKFQAKIAKSYRDMLSALKEAVSPAQQAAIAISKKERGEKPKKESVLDRIDRKIKEKNDG